MNVKNRQINTGSRLDIARKLEGWRKELELWFMGVIFSDRNLLS